MEINKDNVQMAINIMIRAKVHGQKLDMREWQKISPNHIIKITESSVYNFFIPCCMAGFIAVSPEFQACGGEVGLWGHPVLNGCGEALSEWFNIDQVEAEALACADNLDDEKIPEYSGKKLEDITFNDVISVLERLRDTGTIYPD